MMSQRNIGHGGLHITSVQKKQQQQQNNNFHVLLSHFGQMLDKK